MFLGSGWPLFTGVSKNSRLEFVEAKPYVSDDVMLRAVELDDAITLAAMRSA
jgi:hypothetical protein